MTLAAESTTTGITIDLGAGDDTLNLFASSAFGTFDGGADSDTLSVSGTGITLDGGGHSNFEMLDFAAGSNTLSGTHSGLTASSIATGAMLDLASGSSLSGDLSNSGMLTVAGSGIGSATISGDLTLNAGGTVSLNTLTDGSFDQIMVGRAVFVDGTLALGQQTTMPDGTVVLIDGASLSGSFATTTGLISGALISQAIVYDSLTGEVRLVTSVQAIDPAFPTGCTVSLSSPLADGGTLTCISASPITQELATSVDGVTIIIGNSSTPTTVMTSSGNAIYASIAGDSAAAGSITINSEFGIISGGANGITASTAGTGGISITTADVTGIAAYGISSQITNSAAASDIIINSSGGTVTGNYSSISARNAGTGGISITTANVNSANGSGIFANLSNEGASGAITIDSTAGIASGLQRGISVVNAGSGTTTITVSDVSASSGTGIFTVTTTGANITVNAGGTVSGSGGNAAIETGAPDGVSATPADSITIRGTVSGGNISTLTGADSVTLAAGSTTTGITIDLGAGDDRLDLASATFGALDGGPGTDTLSLSGTGITLSGGGHSNFEMLAFAQGSHTLSGTHSVLTASVATGAALDLASGSSLAGDLSNSGTLTIAGAGIGSATITGGLVLNASGTVSLNTLTDGSFDQIMVTGAVSIDGILALGQQVTMPAGTVVLIDGASLSGSFAITTGLINGLLIGQAIAYDTTSGEVRLVTTTLTPETDSAFPTGCTVTPSSPLAAGGTLTCISTTPITETIATSVDGVRIFIGDSSTPTTVMSASGDAINASIASTSASGNISINSAFGLISGAANGIVASTAGSGSITIAAASVTGNAGDAISATTAGGAITISGAHTVLGTGGLGIEAISGGGDISIQGVGATGGVESTGGHGIFADARRRLRRQYQYRRHNRNRRCHQQRRQQSSGYLRAPMAATLVSLSTQAVAPS